MQGSDVIGSQVYALKELGLLFEKGYFQHVSSQQNWVRARLRDVLKLKELNQLGTVYGKLTSTRHRRVGAPCCCWQCRGAAEVEVSRCSEGLGLHPAKPKS